MALAWGDAGQGCVGDGAGLTPAGGARPGGARPAQASLQMGRSAAGLGLKDGVSGPREWVRGLGPNFGVGKGGRRNALASAGEGTCPSPATAGGYL